MLALMLALLAQDPADKKVDLEKTKLFVYDSERGLKLRVADDGRVDLTVKQESWTAPDVEEFKRKHGDVVRRHGLQKYLGGGGTTVLVEDEFDRLWQELRRPRFRAFPEEDLKKLFEDQQKQMEELRRMFRGPGVDPAPPQAEPAPGGREFGVRMDSVDETLRDQLSLAEGEGVVVASVKPGSVAEKAGVKPFDLLLKVDGKKVGDKWQFRTDVLEALGKAEFELEIVRGGKRQTLKVKPAPRKEE